MICDCSCSGKSGIVRLSCLLASEIFPDQVLNLCPLHWPADTQPLDHQGSPIFLLLHPSDKLLLSIPESTPLAPALAACVVSGHLCSPPDHELLGASPDTSRPGTDLCSVCVNEQIQSNMTDSQEALELEGGDGALVLLLNYSRSQASSFIYSSLGFLIFIK